MRTIYISIRFSTKTRSHLLNTPLYDIKPNNFGKPHKIPNEVYKSTKIGIKQSILSCYVIRQIYN